MSVKYITNELIAKKFLDQSIIEYFQKKIPNSLNEDIVIRAVELIKFFLLSEYFKGDVPFSEELDEMWHLWILQTKEYANLMKALPHKKFIHHSSHEYIEKNKENLSSKDKINTQFSYLVSYVLNFGPFKQEEILFYPYAMALLKERNMNLEEFNSYLKQEIPVI